MNYDFGLTLVEALQIQQKREGLSNAQFAKRLGVSESTWDAYRLGRREMSARFYAAILATFRDLEPYIGDDLRRRAGLEMKRFTRKFENVDDS